MFAVCMGERACERVDTPTLSDFLALTLDIRTHLCGGDPPSPKAVPVPVGHLDALRAHGAMGR